MEHIFVALPLWVRLLLADEEPFRQWALCRSSWPELGDITDSTKTLLMIVSALKMARTYKQGSNRNVVNGLFTALSVTMRKDLKISLMRPILDRLRETMRYTSTHIRQFVIRWGLDKGHLVGCGYLKHMLTYAEAGMWKEVRNAYGLTAEDVLKSTDEHPGTEWLHTGWMENMGYFREMVHLFSFSREDLIKLINIDTQQGYCLSGSQYMVVKSQGIGPADVERTYYPQLISVLKEDGGGKLRVLKWLYGYTASDVVKVLSGLHVKTLSPLRKELLDVFGIRDVYETWRFA